jgi:hypothetical protein
VRLPPNGDVDRYDLGHRFLESAWGRAIATEAALACMAAASTKSMSPTAPAVARIDES